MELIQLNSEAQHISYRLNNPDYNMDEFPDDFMPIEDILGLILAGTGFTVGTVEIEGLDSYSFMKPRVEDKC
jgi:hypothetical protein